MAVKFTVTPLGATPGDEPGTARRIVAYLMGTAPHPGRPMIGPLPATTGTGTGGGSRSGRSVAGYYRSDQLEGDGWWAGRAAWRLALDGPVDAAVLESLLSGRHPVTGERLLSARGSAGRGSLKRGEYTRLVDGEPVWDAEDAAARFDTNPDDLALALVEVSRDGHVDADGQEWLTQSGIDQLARVFDTPPKLDHRDVLAVLEALPEDGVVSVSEASRLTGLSEQHFRQVIAEWHDHRPAIDTGLAGRALPHPKAWLPAEKVDSRWQISVPDLVAFWERRRPPAVRVAYDVVATVEKSVSILTLLSGPEVRTGCVEALLAANEAGMDWLDEHASKGRRLGERVSSEGFVRAGFLHATSRALDPHPHVHNLVLNFLQDPYGERRAIDARHLHTQAKAASAIATSVLRWELIRRWPGLRWEQHNRSGVWELAGIDAALVAEFSTRRTEIEAAARQLLTPDGRLPTRGELQEISAATRPPKQTVEAAEVLAGWLARAERHGFKPTAITNPAARGRRLAPMLDPAEQAALFEFLATSPDGVCATESTFTFGDLLAAINRWAPGGQPRPLSAPALIQAANQFLATPTAIPFQPEPDHLQNAIRRRDGRPSGADLAEERWTTTHMVTTQVQILDTWNAGRNTGHLTDIPTAAIHTVTGGLDPDQVDLVERWTTSGHQFQCAIGRPGTGKTYTMTAARHHWEAHGWRVVGAAVKGTAAQHLARETGIPSDTVAHHLTATTYGHPPVDARTVLVVDEATTLSDRDLAALLHLCATTGAALRMIGDPAQQRSVAAGGMWAHLATTDPDTPELTHQHRLQDPDEARTAELLRSGHIRSALDQLLATGKLRHAQSHDHGEQLALVGWLDRRQRGIDSPMINRRNHTRRRLNHIAQTILTITGTVTRPRIYPTGTVGVGDRVIATAPARHLHPPDHPDRYVTNGTTGTVTHTHRHHLIVDFDQLGTITIPRDDIHRIDLAYALTAYSVQGATYPEAETTATPGEPLNSLYVTLTRGQHSNTLIAARPPPTETHEPTRPPSDDIAGQLARTVTDHRPVPALIADPDLRHLTDNHLPTGLRNRTAKTQELRALHAARAQPPDTFTANYPPKPTAPWLAELWDRALAMTATYHQEPNGHHPSLTATGHHPILGPEPPAGTPHHDNWSEAAQTLAGIAAILEDHRDAYHPGQPPTPADPTTPCSPPPRPTRRPTAPGTERPVTPVRVRPSTAWA